MSLITLEVSSEKEVRLDRYIAENTDLSRNFVQRLIREGNVLLNNNQVKGSTIVKKGEIISIKIPEPAKLKLKAEKIPLDVLYEDKYLLVINKPQGMVVHPAKGHESGTLVHGLLAYCKDLSGIGGQARPGIVHRLDKDTSGLLIVAKDDKTHKKLSLALEKREVERTYVAIVQGRWDAGEGTISAPIARHPTKRVCMAVVQNGRNAITHFKVLRVFDKHGFVQLKLETGRTHQIRVHMAFVGHPVVGDRIYNQDVTDDEKLLLHAAKLKFNHPASGDEICLVAKLPNYFKEKLRELY